MQKITLAYWKAYLDTLSDPPKNPTVRATVAGNHQITDELLELYLSGRKTAGSGLLKDYEVTGDPLPKVGDYWIILDSKEIPRCIVKTVRVENYRFDLVPEEVARAEGEGDLSLQHWRKVHIEFFTPFLKTWGVDDLEKATLITEFFELVYQ